jgi:uncharacterized protein
VSYPLRQFILKVHSRCDLACDHCYIYEHVDQSWRHRPMVMAPETVRSVAARIAEHARDHGLPSVRIVLHGGEPLLLGPTGLRSTLEELTSGVGSVAKLDLRMQTNGLLLSEAMCELLAEFDVRVGVSLDGGRVANDRHRRYANGLSSHAGVLTALALLRRHRRIYAGLLCTIDVRNDPIEVYEALLEQQPPRIDFLLPHATWDTPPMRPAGDPTPYARWLGRIFDRWEADGRPTRIRLFESLLSAGKGGPSGTESVGLDPADLVVVETDGAWEQADSLKVAFDGAPGTGLTVFSHTVDQVSVLPEIAGRQLGLAGLCATCRACPVVRQCGGGLYAHRFRSVNGFDNPSAYCADLLEFIVHVNREAAAPSVSPATAQPDGHDQWPPDLVERIGSGYGDESAVTYLVESQLAINRALVVAVADLARHHPYAGHGWELLKDLDVRAPDAVRSVLSHPYVRPWAVGCLRQSDAHDADLAHLCLLAAAAAVRAGVSTDLPVPVSGGRVHLPTLGTLVAPGLATDLADVRIQPDSFTVRAGDGAVTVVPGRPADGTGWRPVRRIATDGLDLLLDDADPYRDCHDWPVEDPLTTDRADDWQRTVVAAWRAIRDEAPAQAVGLRQGLRAVVPLRVGAGDRFRASTARDAFGAVGATPATAQALAVMLVHEFQHGKLGALLDLCDLVDMDYTRRIKVGWRDDLRPMEGVLQGTYAHLAVADIWRFRAGRPGADAAAARANYVRYRDWTEAAIDAMAGSGALTAPGMRFVDSMGHTISAWAP